MKYASTLVSVVILCLAMAQVAVVAGVVEPQDPLPPPWDDVVSQTFQWWLFNSDETGQGLPNGLPPDGPGPLNEGPPYEAGFLPSTNVVVYPDPPEWMETDTVHGSNRIGIWSLSGYIDVIVDNHNPPNEFKWVWLQLTWAQESVNGDSVPAFTNLAPAADPNYPVTLTDERDWGDGWKTSVYQWRIYPNPADEAFTIGCELNSGAGILVDELVIDTWCIPEPATLGLLLLSSLALLRRKR